ncbi:MAG: ABC transporter ATP-binding protein [Nocardioidaceae bacterium]|nr:ABC transporter ATP-binding protein [Nocardioidaceae bacterium]
MVPLDEHVRSYPVTDPKPATEQGLALQVRGLHRSYDAPVLRGLDLDVCQSDLVAVLGPSGCGKTTLLRTVAGFDHADAGTVALGGSFVDAPRVFVQPEHRKVGIVAQTGALFPHLSVARNIGYGLDRGRASHRRVDELLELVGLGGLGRRMPHELSGGQQQRVAVARALAPRPRLLLLDEPFAALDSTLRSSLRADVRDAIHAEGATAVLVTHDQDEALSMADQVAILQDGQVVQMAPPRQIYEEPVDLNVARSLGEAMVLPGRLTEGRVSTALGWLEVGHRSPAAAPGQPPDVLVLLRPEQLELDVASGVKCKVVSTAYFGHDGLIGLIPAAAGAGGLGLAARIMGPSRVPAVGEHVQVGVRGSVAVYPSA